jgi:hypothetical protein
VLYPLDRLFGTTAGHLVLGMAVLWTCMNGLLELGVYRMQAADGGRLTLQSYMTEGFVLDGDVDVPKIAGIGRPYVFSAVVLAVLLLVDAALLAGGSSV